MMRCEQAREALTLRDAGALGSTELVRLQNHLGRCNACVEFARNERAIVEELASLRGRADVTVDVRARVLREVRELEPGTGDRVSPFQLGWAAAAALAASVGLAWGFRWAEPGMGAAGGKLVALGGTGLSLGAQLLEGLLSAGSGAMEQVAQHGLKLQAATPLLTATTAVAYASMAGAIGWILVREFRRAPAAVPSRNAKDRMR